MPTEGMHADSCEYDTIIEDGFRESEAYEVVRNFCRGMLNFVRLNFFFCRLSVVEQFSLIVFKTFYI